MWTLEELKNLQSKRFMENVISDPNFQPERSKREDLHIEEYPHLKIEDMENMTKVEMIEKMKIMEDTIIRNYIQMTSCHIRPKCVRCGALNSMET